jgi:tetratricopeptide (TPR) repeat protein
MEKHLSKNGLCCGLIGLFALLLWGQTARFAFVWDDDIYIAQNKSIRSLANLPKIFSRMEAQSAETPSISYRPLRNAVYALLHALDGGETPQPWIFHLANVLWHGAAAMLLFWVALLLCQRLTGGVSTAARTASLLIALGFAAHPANTEAVCWAKCMDDLMAGVFVLAAARSLLKWNEGGRGYVAALVWFLLAVLSKESAVPFALAVFFMLHGFHKLPWRRSARLSIPFLLVAFFYAACRHWVMGRSSQCPPLSGTYGQTLMDMFPVALEYWRLLWGIPPFCADYNGMVGAPPHPFLSGGVLGGVFLVLFAGALAAWLWRREDCRMAAFGIIWLGLFLLPVSNLVPMMQYMAERFLYLPLMGFLLALGALCLRMRRRGLAGAGAGLLILVWAASSRERLDIWQDEVKLFVQTSLANPASWRPRENAVIAIFRLPQIQPFFSLDPVTHQLLPGPPPRTADAGAMLRTLTQAHSLFPDEHRFTAALGIACALRGQMTNAIPLLELATRQQTNDAECWIDLGTAYTLENNWPQARAALQSALRLNPTNRLALLRLHELKEKLDQRQRR